MKYALSIQENIPLDDKNWFQTGGPARFFTEPTTVAEFQEALTWAHEQKLPIFILGCGANILISDEGFDGLVIRPALKNITHKSIDDEYALASAGGGCTFEDLINYCLEHNLTGLEEFSGIPASVGGATYGNLHYFDHNLGHFLVAAELIEKETGILQKVTSDWFNFGYDSSRLNDRNEYVTQAAFRVKKASDLETAYAQGRRAEIIRHRIKRYPATHTCGSFFRNFHPDEVTLEQGGRKIIFVAYYLDKLGVKGALTVGDAAVSWQHANMFVNQGNATSADICKLARTIQEQALETYGILPQPECELIGFAEYPLLQK